MTKVEQEDCFECILKYQTTKDNKERDDLYFKLKESLNIWVKSILRRWNIYATDQEVLSLTWHCYIHALENYKNQQIPIPFHFYTYSMYYLYNEYVRNKRELNMELEQIDRNNYDLSLKEVYNNLPSIPRQILLDILTKKSTIKTKGNYYKHKKQLKIILRDLYIV